MSWSAATGSVSGASRDSCSALYSTSFSSSADPPLSVSSVHASFTLKQFTNTDLCYTPAVYLGSIGGGKPEAPIFPVLLDHLMLSSAGKVVHTHVPLTPSRSLCSQQIPDRLTWFCHKSIFLWNFSTWIILKLLRLVKNVSCSNYPVSSWRNVSWNLKVK